MNCYEIVKEKIETKLKDALEKGEKFHWVKPWKGGVEVAWRYKENKAYRGINQLLLDAGEYLTFKQMLEYQEKNKDIKLKKGSKAEHIFFYSFKEKEDEDGNKKGYPIFRYFSVYNVADVENLDLRFPPIHIEHQITENVQKAIEVLESFEKRNGLKVSTRTGSTKAYYSSNDHSIVLPDISQFKSMYEYIGTRAHEDVHATSKDLKRTLGQSFGDEKYSKEELVAEIGAAMFCARMQIFDDSVSDNSISYVQHWLRKVGEENIYFITNAANLAQKAMDLIFDEVLTYEKEPNVTIEEEQKQEQEKEIVA